VALSKRNHDGSALPSSKIAEYDRTSSISMSLNVFSSKVKSNELFSSTD